VLKVGITGGIGSGKSIVCQVFKSLGIPVYNADQRAKDLIETDSSIRSKIVHLFGTKAYVHAEYNRKLIASKVFHNKALLEKLNSIIHPAVGEDFLIWTRKYTNSPYVIEEAAILFESGANIKMDFNVVVYADENLRISRIQKRDELRREEITSRIKNQWPAEKIRTLADWVIDNNDKILVLPQILKIHQILLQKSIM
jgi:dephospho-CoA kinase